MFTENVAIMHTLESAPYPSNECGVARLEFKSHGGWPMRQVFVTWDLEEGYKLRAGILTAVVNMGSVVWDVAPCSWIDRH